MLACAIQVVGLEKRLGSSGFLSKASDDVVAETKQQLDEKKERLSTIQKSLDKLKTLA